MVFGLKIGQEWSSFILLAISVALATIRSLERSFVLTDIELLSRSTRRQVGTCLHPELQWLTPMITTRN